MMVNDMETNNIVQIVWLIVLFLYSLQSALCFAILLINVNRIKLGGNFILFYLRTFYEYPTFFFKWSRCVVKNKCKTLNFFFFRVEFSSLFTDRPERLNQEPLPNQPELKFIFSKIAHMPSCIHETFYPYFKEKYMSLSLIARALSIPYL